MPNETPLTLIELLNMANQGYPDEYLSEYYDPATGNRRDGDGDTLAKFIVIELRDTFDESASRTEQVGEAHRALDRAIGDLEAVIRAIR